MFHLHTPVLARRDTMREKENFIPVLCSSPGGAVAGPHKKESSLFTVGKYTPKFRQKQTLKKAVSASSAVTPKRSRRKSLVAYIKSKCTPKAESNKLKVRNTNVNNQSDHIRDAMKKYKSAGVLSQTSTNCLAPMDVVEVNCIPSSHMNFPYSDTPRNKVRKLDSDSSLRSTDSSVVDSTMSSDSSMFNSTSNSSNSSLSSLERTYDLRSLSKRSASEMCLREPKSKTPKIRAGLVTRRSKLSVFEFKDDILEDKENQTSSNKKRRSSLILRKRKRFCTDNEDTVSLQSVDIINDVDEPKKRRRSSLAKMTSLSGLLSPMKPMKKVGHALQKSLSLKNLMSPSPNKYNVNAYKKPQPTPPKRRQSTFWYETVNSHTTQKFSSKEIERQEAIFELYKCEEDLIEDLKMVKATYYDSMAKLQLLTDEELKQIFGPITTLVPLHEEIVESLRDQRLQDGTTDSIGKALLEWVHRLREYIPYCANQVYARALLDVKRQEPAIDDFLQRCQDSPFSRRLDLWSFLDVPRSRLVKYPLIFKNILKLTPADHRDVALIKKTVDIVEDIIQEVDTRTGQSKCALTKDKLEYIDDKQKSHLIDESEVVLCDGVLKNNRGTKLYVFLFNKILVLTRVATRGQQLKYQVYRQPLPVSDLLLDEMQDGQTGKSGSFRSHFSQSSTCKSVFKVSLKDGGKGVSHTLQCNDEHDKRQWILSLKEIISPENIVTSSSQAPSSPTPSQRSISSNGSSNSDDEDNKENKK